MPFSEAFLIYLNQPSRSRLEKLRASPLLDHWRDTPLRQITQQQVDRYVAQRYPTGAAPATIARFVYTPLIAIMRGAKHVPNLTPPQVRNGKISYLTRDEADRLIDAAAPHLKPLITFCLNTGARLGEALSLDWANVDLARARVRFVETKNGESRGVPLNQAALAALMSLPSRRGAVFRNHIGEAYAPKDGEGGQIKTGWRLACLRAGLYTEIISRDQKTGGVVRRKKHRFTPHDLRHTFASWLVMEGVSIMAVKELMGHKTLKMTLRYAHLAPDHLSGAVAALDPRPVQNPGAMLKIVSK